MQCDGYDPSYTQHIMTGTLHTLNLRPSSFTKAVLHIQTVSERVGKMLWSAKYG